MSKTADFFNTLNERAANNEFSSAAGHVFQFIIEGAGTWTLDLKDGNTAKEGGTDNADCTIETDSGTFEAMLEDPMVAMNAFMSGALKADNLTLAMQLQQFLG